ncbi:MAG: hypothetical protein K5880_14630 [Hydrogenophaga sp.]|uniref:ATP-dependent DNA ligase n=1 Tax=Hydrogenophaga sp. TaxID=1904254 RepID=UPI00261D9BB7|nr:hypothetical protein [Hydrogenophaga sp.]MCV0439849.1 hypothetical protein [Hydrogenophaga sp.]
MNLPTLYHKAKGGDLRQWRVWSEGDTIYTEYGQVGGKLQTSEKIAEPKNIGRSNETTPEEQALSEAQSLWQYKVDRKYSETPEGAEETLPLPMLAHGYKGTKAKKFVWPGHTQPKLDGVRCLAERDDTDNVVLTSRQGKPWNIPHVAEQLALWLPPGTTLDGELYVHGESCQRITSWAKSADPSGKSYKPESLQLVYHVYDIPKVKGDDALPWSQRGGMLMHYLQESENVVRVESTLAGSEDELWTIHGSYIGEGYEGAILRGMDGLYLWGYRSADLLKVKQFQDAEFRVIEARDGKGKMSGCVVWTCMNDETEGTFECTMKVPMAERRRMYEERDRYMGQLLTVRFFDRTDDNIPRFPVGIVFRDEIDLPG